MERTKPSSPKATALVGFVGLSGDHFLILLPPGRTLPCAVVVAVLTELKYWAKGRENGIILNIAVISGKLHVK